MKWHNQSVKSVRWVTFKTRIPKKTVNSVQPEHMQVRPVLRVVNSVHQELTRLKSLPLAVMFVKTVQKIPTIYHFGLVVIYVRLGLHLRVVLPVVQNVHLPVRVVLDTGRKVADVNCALLAIFQTTVFANSVQVVIYPTKTEQTRQQVTSFFYMPQTAQMNVNSAKLGLVHLKQDVENVLLASTRIIDCVLTVKLVNLEPMHLT